MYLRDFQRRKFGLVSKMQCLIFWLRAVHEAQEIGWQFFDNAGRAGRIGIVAKQFYIHPTFEMCLDNCHPRASALETVSRCSIVVCGAF
ncbi:hypothetical protein AB833_15220 [Chromatiales bacterium (ex Bugula neritina AB1)]|nr:hypothetical protein AB833_15220 [Chromatiales bacterium (ex Bugula neritina AB1)]